MANVRFDIDLLISRYFIVLMVGKDRRQASRPRPVSRLNQFGNWVAAVVLLLGFNLALSTSVLMLSSRPNAEVRADTSVCPYGVLRFYLDGGAGLLGLNFERSLVLPNIEVRNRVPI